MDQGKNNQAHQKIDTEKWVWCKRCYRCYLAGEFRIVKGIKLCPYENCMGLIEIDGWPWSRILREYPKEYPSVPERDILYPKTLD